MSIMQRLKNSGLWFHQMFKIFSHYLLNFLSSLSLFLFFKGFQLYVYLFSIFMLCASFLFHLLYLPSSLIFSYAMSNLLLILSSVFFISDVNSHLHKFHLGLSGIFCISLHCVHVFLYFLESIEYIYNSCFSSLSFLCLLSLTGFSPGYGSYFPATFACLEDFYRKPDIINFTLLFAGFCCVPLNYVRLCLGINSVTWNQFDPFKAHF